MKYIFNMYLLLSIMYRTQMPTINQADLLEFNGKKWKFYFKLQFSRNFIIWHVCSIWFDHLFVSNEILICTSKTTGDRFWSKKVKVIWRGSFLRVKCIINFASHLTVVYIWSAFKTFIAIIFQHVIYESTRCHFMSKIRVLSNFKDTFFSFS